MLYSSACEYAIRALIYLVKQQPDQFILLREIAKAEGIPYPFLGKIFQNLVRAGVLRSAKGLHGGYALVRPPEEITLYHIKEVIDGTADLERCITGLDRCSDEMICPLHETWKPLRQEIKYFLQNTSMADIAQAVQKKRIVLTQSVRKPKGE